MNRSVKTVKKVREEKEIGQRKLTKSLFLQRSPENFSNHIEVLFTNEKSCRHLMNQFFIQRKQRAHLDSAMKTWTASSRASAGYLNNEKKN